jgi:hypothetical protein
MPLMWRYNGQKLQNRKSRVVVGGDAVVYYVNDYLFTTEKGEKFAWQPNCAPG